MRSIDQIMKSAWQEVKDTHGVGLESVDFTVIQSVVGDCFLGQVKINGGTYHVFKNNLDLDTSE